MIETRDIIWLGGLLEGEGWFILHKKKYPAIGVNMTAEDTIVKVSAMWDTRIYREGNQWRTLITGAYAIQWMFMLYPFLGKCRQKSIREIVKFWKEYSYARTSNGMRTMATCHPHRIVVGHGLCSPCYMKWYHKNRGRGKQLLEKVG